VSVPTLPAPVRGEIFLLNFSPATGREMTGVHPSIIVQNDLGNRFSDLTIVVAVTSNLRVASLPVGVFLPAGMGGLHRDSAAHCGHLYTVDKSRLGVKIGELPADKMVEINEALAVSVGLKP